MSRTHSRDLAEQGHKPVVAGLWMNGVLAAAKITAGIWGHSFALVADGFESFADVFSSAIVYLGLRLSAKPRDENHPYGHGKVEFFSAGVEGTLIATAALLIAVEAVKQILAGTAPERLDVGQIGRAHV